METQRRLANYVFIQFRCTHAPHLSSGRDYMFGCGCAWANQGFDEMGTKVYFYCGGFQPRKGILKLVNNRHSKPGNHYGDQDTAVSGA